MVTCSACRGEGGALQARISGVCGERSQCLGHTGFAPAHGVCAFTVCTAQAPGCSAGELSKVRPGSRALPRSGSGSRVLHKGADSVDPASCSLPRSEQLSGQVLGKHTLPRWAVRLITSRVSAAPFPGCTANGGGSAFSGVPCVSSGELISACDPPGGCQPSKIPGRLG